MIAPLPHHIVDELVRRTLAEDLGHLGDLSSDLAIPAEQQVTATLVARQAGTIAGLEVALAVVSHVAPTTTCTRHVGDGQQVAAGTALATLDGPARGLLTAERSALNLLGHASGIATATRRAVDAVAGTTARITDTRKTTPGLRALERFAVRCGGGVNHRSSLADAVMLKDNHLAAVGSIHRAVSRVRAGTGHTVHVEVEIDRLDQLEDALEAGADSVLLDNLAPDALREAVERTAGRAVLEASGGIAIDDLPAIAATGVDVISLGWLTHSAPRLDVALDVPLTEAPSLD